MAKLLPGLCLIFAFDPHLEDTLERSTFLFWICTWGDKKQELSTETPLHTLEAQGHLEQQAVLGAPALPASSCCTLPGILPGQSWGHSELGGKRGTELRAGTGQRDSPELRAQNPGDRDRDSQTPCQGPQSFSLCSPPQGEAPGRAQRP